jgi:hypothetical protein
MTTNNRLRILSYKLKRQWLKPPSDMFPIWKTGKYVDVLKHRGGYTVITSHYERVLSKPGTIILIPYQPNHGVMVEYKPADGKGGWRNLLDYDKLYQLFTNDAHEDKGKS